MRTLVVANVPDDVYESLRRHATARRRSLSEAAMDILGEFLRADEKPSHRLPDLVSSDEISAPFDLLRSSVPVQVSFVCGKIRLPDSLKLADTMKQSTYSL